jgi:hypothetical protein
MPSARRRRERETVAADGGLRIGIDLDNTLACYESLFADLARERGLLSARAAPSRVELRNRLRREGQEEAWTEMQGEAYGPRMRDAEPFAGAVEFVARCIEGGAKVFIVSHRSRHPYRGKRHDLHAAANDWLARHRFVGRGGVGLTRRNVFLEPEWQRKLARISTLGCTHFIDDLREILEHERFPQSVVPILFDPTGASKRQARIARADSWSDVATLIFGAVKSGTRRGKR